MSIEPSTLSPSWSQLPLESRFKEKMFRRFEPLMTIAVQRAPQETEFSCPPELSLNTFVARFRDAFLSLKRYEWNKTPQGTTIPLEKLRSLQGKFGLYPHPATNTVWFRAKQQTGDHKKLPAAWSGRNDHGGPPAPWIEPQPDEIAALCVLLHTRRLTGPFTLACPFSPELTESLLARFDISIVWDEKQLATILN